MRPGGPPNSSGSTESMRRPCTGSARICPRTRWPDAPRGDSAGDQHAHELYGRPPGRVHDAAARGRPEHPVHLDHPGRRGGRPSDRGSPLGRLGCRASPGVWPGGAREKVKDLAHVGNGRSVLLGRFLGPGFLLAGLVALAVAVARNEASVALVFVVPVVIGSGRLAFLGVLLILDRKSVV